MSTKLMARRARRVRLVIWLLSAVAAGAIKPMFFPEGGVSYVIAAFLLLAVCAVLGVVIERWLLSGEATGPEKKGPE